MSLARCAAPQSRDPHSLRSHHGPRLSSAAARAALCVRGRRLPYAMNMRAAEATVSSAPKPMKIFPIREV
jgi:hypothetical protein